MRKTKERAQGCHPKRVENDMFQSPREESIQSHGIVPPMRWPIHLTIGQQIELIASSLGPIGIFVAGVFVANISPAQLRQLGESALSLANALEQDRAARDWSQEQLAAARTGQC